MKKRLEEFWRNNKRAIFGVILGFLLSFPAMWLWETVAAPHLFNVPQPDIYVKATVIPKSEISSIVWGDYLKGKWNIPYKDPYILYIVEVGNGYRRRNQFNTSTTIVKNANINLHFPAGVFKVDKIFSWGNDCIIEDKQILIYSPQKGFTYIKSSDLLNIDKSDTFNVDGTLNIFCNSINNGGYLRLEVYADKSEPIYKNTKIDDINAFGNFYWQNYRKNSKGNITDIFSIIYAN
jgi:hypothetical protein